MGGRSGNGSRNNDVSRIVADRREELKGMSKQEKIDYLQTMIETQQYRKDHNQDTSVVDAVIEEVRQDLIKSSQSKTQFHSSVVEGSVSKNIQTVLNDSAALETEQTILVGEKTGRYGSLGYRDTLLNPESKKALINEVKTALKQAGRKPSDYSISITTPHIGPGIFSNYLKIRPKKQD